MIAHIFGWFFVSFLFFFKQKTAYEMRISDWSSDVCSSDLDAVRRAAQRFGPVQLIFAADAGIVDQQRERLARHAVDDRVDARRRREVACDGLETEPRHRPQFLRRAAGDDHLGARTLQLQRDLAPDPVAAAGDQRELSTKFHKTPPMFYLAHYGGSQDRKRVV